MIVEALKVMLFGMIGIFLVMGLIIISIRALNFFQKDKPQDNSQEGTDE